MAEASPIEHGGRARRGQRRGRVPDHVGDRCTMCGRMVAVDALGRCALGHQVITADEARTRRVTDADEPRSATTTPRPTPAPDPPRRPAPIEPRTARGASAPQPPRVFDDPPPPLPADAACTLLTDDRAAVESMHGRAVVPMSDLTPSAPSALDVDDATWTPGDAPVERRYAQVPVDDVGREPPRGLLQMIAGGLFVAVLLGIAWYLATSL